MLVLGIWGFGDFLQQSREFSSVCVRECVLERERGKDWEEGSQYFPVLCVNPWYCPICYIRPFHLSWGWCVACMENKHVLQMCVSNATRWPDPSVYLCACAVPFRSMFYSEYELWTGGTRGYTHAHAHAEKINQHMCGCRKKWEAKVGGRRKRVEEEEEDGSEDQRAERMYWSSAQRVNKVV